MVCLFVCHAALDPTSRGLYSQQVSLSALSLLFAPCSGVGWRRLIPAADHDSRDPPLSAGQHALHVPPHQQPRALCWLRRAKHCLWCPSRGHHHHHQRRHRSAGTRRRQGRGDSSGRRDTDNRAVVTGGWTSQPVSSPAVYISCTPSSPACSHNYAGPLCIGVMWYLPHTRLSIGVYFSCHIIVYFLNFINFNYHVCIKTRDS